MAKSRSTKRTADLQNGQLNGSADRPKRRVFDLESHIKPPRWNVDGAYPYAKKMGVVEYEENKHELQIELLKVQKWVRETGQRVVVLFEGRDAAGKGGHHQALHRASQPTWCARCCA